MTRSDTTAPPGGEPNPSEPNTEPAPLLTPLPQETGSVDTIPNRGNTSVESVAGTGMQLPDWSAGEWAAYSSLILTALILTAIAVTTLWWMLHAWRSRDSLQRTGFTQAPRPAGYSFTLLVPGRHEEEVLGQTLDRLAQQDHPDFEIIAIVGDDDPGTARVARAAAARHPDLIKVVVDYSIPKNKPKALNTALKSAR